MRKIITSLLGVLLGVNFLYVFSGALHLPVISIDALGIWLLKAKAWYLEEGVPLELLRNPEHIHSHPQYPVLLPYLFSRIYFVNGGVHERLILLLYPFLYALCLLLAFFAFRKLKLPVLFSLLCVYVYSMFSPLLAQGGREHAGDADIFITILIWILVLIILSVPEKVKVSWRSYVWTVPTIIIASQIKGEGLFLITSLVWVPIPKTQRLVLICISALPAILWQWFRIQNGIPADFTFHLLPVSELVLRTITIFAGTAREMANWRNWYYFWPLFWGALALGKSDSPTMQKQITLTLLSMSGCFFLIYLLATVDTWMYVTSSVDRILLQLSPLWFLIFVERLYAALQALQNMSMQQKLKMVDV